MDAIFEYIAVGGDLSMIVLLYIAWKFDHRVSHLEWWKESMEGDN